MQQKEILDSWKEIASYLRRSERTCRRWEKEFGLPIYRMDGSPRASVFAYKEELARWLDEMLHEEKIPSRKTFLLSRKNLFIILGLATISIFILAVVVWRILPHKTKVSPLFRKPSLAILYFKNNTGEENLDYWRRAICDLLINDLSQSRYLNVLPEDRLFHTLQTLRLLEAEDFTTEDLARIAAQAQVENVVLGNFIKAGESLRINATIKKISSDEDIVIDSVEGKSEAEIFSMVDEVSRRVKTQLELSPDEIDSDLDEEMETITTRSFEAYKYYVEGRRHYPTGRLSQSIRFFEKAIENDPEFAMAYIQLARCYRNLAGYEDEAKNCMKRAFELSQHVSERERLLIQAYYSFQSERTWNKAIKTYQELLQIYPEDYRAIHTLGWLYFYIEDWDKTIETVNKIIHVYYGNAHFALLRRVYCAQGNYTEALEIAKTVPVDLYPFQYPYQLALNLFFHGKLDLALVEAEKMLSKVTEWPPALRLKGDIYLCKEDWIQAEEDYKKCLDPKGLDLIRFRDHNLALIRLASLHLSLGKFERVIDYLKQGVEEFRALGERGWLFDFYLKMAYTRLKKKDISGAMRECQNALDRPLGVRAKINALHIQGLISVELNDLSEAQRAADEVREEVESWLNPKLMRYYYHLMGRIELEKHNFAEAIAYFEKAIAFLPFKYNPDGDEHAPFYEGLALAFYKAGDLEKAREWYEKILSLTSGRLHHGDIYAKSFHMLGMIYEQKGWVGKAIESYEKFLDLWRDADPGIPEVEEAKQRLIALRS